VLPLCCPQDHIEPILLEHARGFGSIAPCLPIENMG
jgi:hypothetical protein